MSRPRRPVEPLLDKLIEGKVPKEIGNPRVINYHLHRYVKESGCRTLLEAVVRYVKRR